MIKVRMQIDGGDIFDTYERFGFIYKSSDNVFAAPTKGFATSKYAEQAGENVDPRTVDDVFDYKVQFIINAPSRNNQLDDANRLIRMFNEAMFTKEYGSDVKSYKTLTFYNDYKRVKIVGIPQPIAEVDEDDFFRDKYGNVYDIAVVELTIHVTNPTLCDFDMDALVQRFTKADLKPGMYFGERDDASKAKIQFQNAENRYYIKVPMAKGSTRYVRTRSRTVARPFYCVDANDTILWQYAEYGTTRSYATESYFGGYLIVNCEGDFVDEFSVMVDETSPNITPTNLNPTTLNEIEE